MKLKLKFKLCYIIQLSYYNSESTSLTVGALLEEGKIKDELNANQLKKN